MTLFPPFFSAKSFLIELILIIIGSNMLYKRLCFSASSYGVSVWHGPSYSSDDAPYCTYVLRLRPLVNS